MIRRIYKNAVLGSSRIQRKIDKEVANARHDQRVEDEIYWKKRMLDEALRYEKIIDMRNERIRQLEKQIKMDKKAYDVYCEDLAYFNDWMNRLEPDFENMKIGIMNEVRKFNSQKDKINKLWVNMRDKDKKIKKLLTKKVN